MGLTTPDVSGSFVIPYSAADSSGCTAAMWFDMNAGTSGTLNLVFCPSLSHRDYLVIVLPANSEVAGGLVGPPAGAAPAGVSSTVTIASADDDSVNSVTLAGNASTLAGNVNALFVAAIPVCRARNTKPSTASPMWSTRLRPGLVQALPEPPH